MLIGPQSLAVLSGESILNGWLPALSTGKLATRFAVIARLGPIKLVRWRDLKTALVSGRNLIDYIRRLNH